MPCPDAVSFQVLLMPASGSTANASRNFFVAKYFRHQVYVLHGSFSPGLESPHEEEQDNLGLSWFQSKAVLCLSTAGHPLSPSPCQPFPPTGVPRSPLNGHTPAFWRAALSGKERSPHFDLAPTKNPLCTLPTVATFHPVTLEGHTWPQCSNTQQRIKPKSREGGLI